MPFISLLYSIIDLIFLQFIPPDSVYVLLVTVLLVAGWAAQVEIWFQCDFFRPYNMCYQFYVKDNPSSTAAGTLEGVSLDVTAAKIAFGLAILTLYVVFYCIIFKTHTQSLSLSLRWSLSLFSGTLLLIKRSNRFTYTIRYVVYLLFAAFMLWKRQRPGFSR